jgi:hypothetical protein
MYASAVDANGPWEKKQISRIIQAVYALSAGKSMSLRKRQSEFAYAFVNHYSWGEV